MGNPIKVKPVEMKTLDLKMGNATVSGKVFSVECVETRRPGMWRLHVEMTDYTSSVAVHKNLTEKEAKGLDGKINPGMWLCVQGKMEPTWDGKDIQLNPYHINVIQHEERQDTAPVKRVELHLHTKMSNMDALTDTKEVIKEAIRWGHPAIAITDHGVASPSRTPGMPPGTRSRSSTAWRATSSTTWTIASPFTAGETAAWTMSSSASILKPPA